MRAAASVLLAGIVVALSSAVFRGRPGDMLLLGGTGLAAAGSLAWLAVTVRDAMRRERARRRERAVLYAELKAALAARYGEEQ